MNLPVSSARRVWAGWSIQSVVRHLLSDVRGGVLARRGDEGEIARPATRERYVDVADVGRVVEVQDPDVDGATLSAHAGGGVCQLDVLGHIVGGKADAAVAAGGDERAVAADSIDGPRRAVADHVAAVGAQPAVVVACGDLVADEDPSTCDPGVSTVRVDLAGVDADELGSFVEHGDDLVRRCHQQHLVAGLSVSPPRMDGVAFHLRGRAAAEALVRVVEVEDVDVAAAESEAGVAFPCIDEAVDAVELDRAERVDGEAEHAASADGRELLWITDEHDTPGALVGEGCEFGELGGGDHAGFVDDHRRSCGQVEAMVGPSRQVVLDQQLVDGVGLDSGLDREYLGGRCRWRHPEHRSSVESELLDGGRKRGGLAGSGRADDEHQLRSPGHCAGRHALWIGEVRRLDGEAVVILLERRPDGGLPTRSVRPPGRALRWWSGPGRSQTR